MTDEPSEYERGVAAGQVLSRLDSHDQHLAKINGSMDRVASEMKRFNDVSQELLLAVQRLSDAADADRATVVTTATALEKAESARRDKSETHWTPFARMITVIVAVATLLAAIGWLIACLH
jgi:hypothetical protein